MLLLLLLAVLRIPLFPPEVLLLFLPPNLDGGAPENVGTADITRFAPLKK
jgi:hypothetical protein